MSATSIAALDHERLREALQLLGVRDIPAHRTGSLRALREIIEAQGAVREIIDRGPEGARSAFVRLAHDGPAPVEELIGRGWWGHGLLPDPLDWLQRRALVVVGEDGRVHPTDEARAGLLALTLDVAPAVEPEPELVHVEAVSCVIVAPDEATLNRALSLHAAALRAVAPTVAVSSKSPTVVSAALRAAGLRIDVDAVMPAADPVSPPLPGTTEEAVGPRAVRTLFERAVGERRQLRLQYFASSRGGAATERVVDPWAFRDDLLRGYCHLREGERTFAVDRVGRALLLPSLVDHPEPGGLTS